MSGKIMIIHQGSGFMVDSLVTNLNKNDFESIVVSPASEQAARELEDCDGVILYAGDYLESTSRFLSDLKNYALNKERPLFVIGYEKDIALVEDVIPSQLIAGRFVRPFDVKALVDRVAFMVLRAEKIPDKKRTILLIDDDALFLKTMLKFLSDKYDVTAVRAGHHAVKYLETHIPDLILLDYEMPVMSGPQTLEKIRANDRTKNIPVIFLTGISDKESVVTVMQMKPDGYLLKNMGKEELLNNIGCFFIAHKWRKIG